MSATTPKNCVRCKVPMQPQKHKPQPGVRAHSARGLCVNCYAVADYHDRLIDHARQTRSRDELLDDYVLLRSQGYGWPACAERLGMTYAAFQRAMHRARAAGDPRAGRIGEAWPPLERAS